MDGNAGLVARRHHLHRRVLQGQGEAHLRQGRVSERSGASLQLEPRWQHAPRDRHPGRRRTWTSPPSRHSFARRSRSTVPERSLESRNRRRRPTGRLPTSALTALRAVARAHESAESRPRSFHRYLPAPRPASPAARARSPAAPRRLRGNDVAAGEAALAQKIAASVAARAARAASIPAISYPEELPISANRDEIRRAIEQHPVVIVCGETGSGKTTQLPKICLEAGRGVAGIIGHTQPRRIAARAVGARIAEELGTPLGQLVGYKLRFQDRSRPEGLIKLMTDGILLAETQGDRFLDAYDTIIVDEAHERSLNIDFLLGYLKWLLPKRPDLKIVITSATIDPERFSKHFGDAPIINVSGRSYPVEIRYRAGRARRGRRRNRAGRAGRDSRGGRRAVARAGGRHPRVPERRARDPRDRRIAAQASSAGLRGAAAVFAALAGGATARLPARRAGAASCWRPTSPRPRSPCPASAR